MAEVNQVSPSRRKRLSSARSNSSISCVSNLSLQINEEAAKDVPPEVREMWLRRITRLKELTDEMRLLMRNIRIKQDELVEINEAQLQLTQNDANRQQKADMLKTMVSISAEIADER